MFKKEIVNQERLDRYMAKVSEMIPSISYETAQMFANVCFAFAILECVDAEMEEEKRADILDDL